MAFSPTRWVSERFVPIMISFIQSTDVVIDCPINITACLPGRDPRYLGTLPGRISGVDASQLATGDHPFRPEAQGVAVLGQPQRSCDIAEVLEQEGDQLRPGCPLPCPDYELSTGAPGDPAADVRSATYETCRSSKTNSISSGSNGSI